MEVGHNLHESGPQWPCFLAVCEWHWKSERIVGVGRVSRPCEPGMASLSPHGWACGVSAQPPHVDKTPEDQFSRDQSSTPCCPPPPGPGLPGGNGNAATLPSR